LKFTNLILACFYDLHIIRINLETLDAVLLSHSAGSVGYSAPQSSSL
jgi:hypothetical protein